MTVAMMQDQSSSEGLCLKDVNTVLVNFNFTNPRVVPQGLRHVERKSERELLERRKQQGVGTGHQVVNNAQQTQVAMLRKGLSSNGFHLVDSHTTEIARPGRQKKYRVVLQFRRMEAGEQAPEIPSEALADLRSLATDAVWSGHVWSNPNGVAAVDLVQRQPGTLPKHAFVTRKGWIVAEPVSQLVAEDGE